MTISVELDDKLVQDAMEFSGQSSKEALLAEALKDYVDRLARKRLIESFGTFDFEPEYDLKAG